MALDSPKMSSVNGCVIAFRTIGDVSRELTSDICEDARCTLYQH